MPKFARPNSYTGKQSNQQWTGDARSATAIEAAAGDSAQLYISPRTLASASEALVDAALLSPGPIGSVAPNTVNSTILTAQTRLEINGGAVTDSIGTATLAAGTVTIANTNIAATDRIIPIRIAANGSTTLGILSYTISAGASFTITSLILGTPGSPQTGDTSTIFYIIVRQV